MDSELYIRKDSTPMLGVHLMIYTKGMLAAGRYKINPRRRLCCITAVDRFKVAKFDLTVSNVRKRPFETGRTTALRSRSIDVIYSAHPRMDRLKLCLITQISVQR